MKKILFAAGILLAFSCSGDDAYLEEQISNEQESLVGIQNTTSNVNEYHEGDFISVYHNGETFLCWIFLGKIRHVDSPLTWNGLFISNKVVRGPFVGFNAAVSATFKPLGTPLFADNGLMRSLEDGRIFFREGNTLRYIKNVYTFNQYQFNGNLIQNVSYVRDVLNGPFIEPALYDTPGKKYSNAGTLDY